MIVSKPEYEYVIKSMVSGLFVALTASTRVPHVVRYAWEAELFTNLNSAHKFMKRYDLMFSYAVTVENVA